MRTDGETKDFLKPVVSRELMYKIEPSEDSNSNRWKVIPEKIVVPSPTGCLPRPRLQALLEKSLRSCTSTIVSGRAGSGKTTLAIDFAEKSGRAVAWYKVDAPESKVHLFFEYLTASIRVQRPGFDRGLTLSSSLEDGADISRVPHLAELFIFELEHAGNPLLIVIEDLHLVCDADWLVPFFQRLLPLLPADVHMLLTSRTMLPAPLWRMRSKQTLSVIDEETLSFTRDEAFRLFEQYGLSREQANIAFDHTHGRAAALSSLATTLRFTETELLGGETTSRRLRVG
jgi:LuxR family maltose regulon positive regulatory protein